MQVEGQRLLAKDREEEAIQLMTQEREAQIGKMSVNELKTRLLKVAQAYKAQKAKNSEFEDQIRQAGKDLEMITTLEKDLESLQSEHKFKS